MSYWMPHTYGLVPFLSKNFSKLLQLFLLSPNFVYFYFFSNLLPVTFPQLSHFFLSFFLSFCSLEIAFLIVDHPQLTSSILYCLLFLFSFSSPFERKKKELLIQRLCIHNTETNTIRPTASFHVRLHKKSLSKAFLPRL